MRDEGIALFQNCGQIWAQHTLKPQKQVVVRLYMGQSLEMGTILYVDEGARGRICMA